MVKDVVTRTPSGALVIASAPTFAGRGRCPDWTLGEHPEGVFLVQVKREVVTAVELRAMDLKLIAHLSGLQGVPRGDSRHLTGEALERIGDAASTLGIW